MASPTEKPPSRPRSYYLDNLKTSLTALVIYHHTAISYGGAGLGIYQSRFHPPSSSTALVGFNAFNQSYFMGSFFFLSAHFSRKTLKRKPRDAFVKDRLYRLGLPTLAYSVLGPPTCHALMQVAAGERPSLEAYTEYWSTLRGVRGPVWFTGVLLVFDLAYAYAAPLLHPKPKAKRDRPDDSPAEASLLHILAPGLTIAACAAASFAIRTTYPVGRTFEPLYLQPAFLPQYVAAYVYGLRVDDPSEAIPSYTSAALLLAASVASWLVIAHATHADASSTLAQIWGGRNRIALAYAVWNETTGYLVGASLLALFRRFANVPWGDVGRYAYSVFLLHMPVSVFVEQCADRWRASGVVKTAVVGTLNVVGSWAAAYGWDRMASVVGLRL